MKAKKDVFFRPDGAVDYRFSGTTDPGPTLPDDQALPYRQRAQMVFDAYLDGLKPTYPTDTEKLYWNRGMTALICSNLDSSTLPFFVELVIQNQVSIKATERVLVRHAAPGGSHEKATAIKAAWASGKYTSRDVCAEQECAAIGMSFSTARKALRNTPEPT